MASTGGNLSALIHLLFAIVVLQKIVPVRISRFSMYLKALSGESSAGISGRLVNKTPRNEYDVNKINLLLDDEFTGFLCIFFHEVIQCLASFPLGLLKVLNYKITIMNHGIIKHERNELHRVEL